MYLYDIRYHIMTQCRVVTIGFWTGDFFRLCLWSWGFNKCGQARSREGSSLMTTWTESNSHGAHDAHGQSATAMHCHVHSTWLRTSSGSEKANGSCSASMHIVSCRRRLVSAGNLLWMYQCKVMAHADIAPCSVSARLGKCSPPPRCKQGTGWLLWVQRNCGSCPVTPDHAHNILHQSFIEAVPGVVDIPGTHQAQKNRSIPQGGPSQPRNFRILLSTRSTTGQRHSEHGHG